LGKHALSSVKKYTFWQKMDFLAKQMDFFGGKKDLFGVS